LRENKIHNGDDVASLFFSYSHADETLRDQLEKQLSMLKHQGIIETWHDRRIGSGSEIDQSISEHVEKDDIILLLVSADFLASDYCYNREMKRAMERHEAGDALVIPVILRACDWHAAPFGKLNATPPDGKPVTLWPDRDQAFLEVAKGIRDAVNRRGGPKAPTAFAAAQPLAQGAPRAEPAGRRSSNLRVAKQFSERDRDRFKLDTFEYVSRFFENSLGELEQRNRGIECEYRRIDNNRFTATVYRDGAAAARCTIFMGGDRYMGAGIAFLFGETSGSNSYNESLTVEADDQAMYLRSMGMQAMGGRRGDADKLSQEGAAELYWSMLINPLQQAQR
jgi:hypothetical protein